MNVGVCMHTVCKGLTLARNANHEETSKNVLNKGYILGINVESKYKIITLTETLVTGMHEF